MRSAAVPSLERRSEHHASTFVWSDLVARVIRATGVEITSCRNVADVDDVLTAAAGARGRDTSEFALYQEYL